MNRNRILLFVLLFIVLVIVAVFYIIPRECPSTLNRSTKCNFDIINSSNPVTFEWCVTYSSPSSYSQSSSRPDYNIEGWGHWTFFGDGEYSWDEHPDHSYDHNASISGFTRYDHIYTERTKIKNNGGPPPGILVNPLEKDTIIVCQDGQMTDHQNDLISGNSGIAFDQSRPAFCDYTFVQIVRFKKSANQNRLRITYDRNEFTGLNGNLPFVLPYVGQPYTFSHSLASGTSAQIDFDITNATVGEEYPICIQFLTTCGTCGDSCNPRICAELIDLEGARETACSEKNIVRGRKPFDPNGIISENTICQMSDRCLRYPLKAYAFFYANGNSQSLCLDTLRIRSLSSNIHSIESGINGNYSLRSSSKNALEYSSCSASNPKSFNGVGSNQSPRASNSTLAEVEFFVKLNKSNLSVNSDLLKFEVYSKFEEIEAYIDTIEIQMEECNDTSLFVPFEVICPPVSNHTNDLGDDDFN